MHNFQIHPAYQIQQRIHILRIRLFTNSTSPVCLFYAATNLIDKKIRENSELIGRLGIGCCSSDQNNSWEVKVHIFWEGHKILRNLHRRFDQCCKFCKSLWPSQYKWTLEVVFSLSSRLQNFAKSLLSIFCAFHSLF